MHLHAPAQPRRFYDGGSDTEPPAPDRPPLIVLERDVRDGRELFRLVRRIAYRDEQYGELLVPDDLDSFRTDLTSVPALFTWLVPKTGNHLPPALVHDGLVESAYRSTDGHVLDRVASDRVFRAAMRDTHTGTVRRWLVWSAVTLATIWVGSAGWSRATHLRYRLVALGTLLLIAGIGAVATLDLFDLGPQLPWMGERPTWLELLGGLAAAVVIPVVLGLLWGRFRVAGAITGVALAVLLHVTAVLSVLTLVYQLAEWLARRRPLAGLVLGGTVLLAFAVLTVLLVTS